MTQATPPHSAKPRLLSGRRIVLLASVAAVGGALLLAGPFSQGLAATGQHARYAERARGRFVSRGAAAAGASARLRRSRCQSETGGDLGARQDSLPPPNRRWRSKWAITTTSSKFRAQPGSPLDKFFQQFGDQFGHQFGQNAPGNQSPNNQTIVGEGSGFFISPDGYAVTNNHVVDHASSVQVTTDDGTIYTAKVIGADPKTDVALIKVDGKNDFPYVKFADHPPQVGDWVVAVGNPFGLGGTVTAGIVSARGRDIGAGPYDDYIQIDAPINKGNSGGPAFDVEGKVIGINTAIYSPSGGSVGIGFDVPADTAKTVVAADEKTRPRDPRLARRADPADDAGHRRQPRPEEGEGAMVDDPQSGQPGRKSRHQVGRRHHCGQRHAGEGRPRSRAHHRYDGAGFAVKLDIIRQGEQATMAVTLAQMPKSNRPATTRQNAGPSRRAASRPARWRRQVTSRRRQRGVVVTGCRSQRACGRAGLPDRHRHTRCRRQDGRQCRRRSPSAGDAKAQGRHDVLMRVKTGDVTRFVAMPLGKA